MDDITTELELSDEDETVPSVSLPPSTLPSQLPAMIVWPALPANHHSGAGSKSAMPSSM